MKDILISREEEFVYLKKRFGEKGHSLKIGETEDLKKRDKKYISDGNDAGYEDTRGGDLVDEDALRYACEDYITEDRIGERRESFHDVPKVRYIFKDSYDKVYNYIITEKEYLFTREHILGHCRVKKTAMLWRGIVYKFGNSLDEIIKNISKITNPSTLLYYIKKRVVEIKTSVGENKEFEIKYFNYLTTFDINKKSSLREEIEILKEKKKSDTYSDPKTKNGWKIIECLNNI